MKLVFSTTTGAAVLLAMMTSSAMPFGVSAATDHHHHGLLRNNSSRPLLPKTTIAASLMGKEEGGGGGGSEPRQLQGVCSSSLVGADIVILFDESGSMQEEQETAAAHTVTMFNAFAAATGSTPRFAVGGFGRNDPGWFGDEIHELTDNFVTSTGPLRDALNRLVTNGQFEEGYKLVDTFDHDSGYLQWDFQAGSRICAIVFTDEDSDGSTSASQVNEAKGSNAVIPVVSNGGNEYSEVSSLPGGQVLSLVEFVQNPTATINTIVNSCVTALAPTARCRDVTVPHLGNCAYQYPANVDLFNAGSSHPQNSPLTYSVSPPGPYSVGVTHVTMVATDPMGNCDTCQAQIRVTNAAPTCRAKDIRVPLNHVDCVWVPPTNLANLINDGSNDPEGSIATLTTNTQGPFTEGTWQVQMTATDNCGATSTCNARVTVYNQHPVALCKDVTVPVNDPSTCSYVPPEDVSTLIDNGSYGPDMNMRLVLTASSQGPFSVGQHAVTLLASDSCGLRERCFATITVTDTPPTAFCRPTEEPMHYYTLGGSDNCGIDGFYVVDSGSGTEWGPYQEGIVFHYEKDSQATPGVAVVANQGVDVFITGNGDAYVKAVDSNGLESDPNAASAWCQGAVPPPPPPPPGAGGDPHFRSWHGELFDYHGQCDLVLLHNPGFHDGLGMNVHVRTKIRYEYSFIESVAVQIGQDVLEVSSFGQYSLNGVDGANLTKSKMAHRFDLDHHQPNEREHAFVIHLDDVEVTDERIVVSSFKDLVNIKFLNATDTNFESSVGLMGSFGKGGGGAFKSRNGRTTLMAMEQEDEEAWNEFGQEWQVQSDEPKLFQVEDNYPQYPEACVLPPNAVERESRRGRRRLGEAEISESEAREACEHWASRDLKDLCIFDVLATNDIELAQAHDAFFR